MLFDAVVVVRLAGSSVPGQGRLEVNYNGVWGTVCDDNFDNNDAAVACYMLGFGLEALFWSLSKTLQVRLAMCLSCYEYIDDIFERIETREPDVKRLSAAIMPSAATVLRVTSYFTYYCTGV